MGGILCSVKMLKVAFFCLIFPLLSMEGMHFVISVPFQCFLLLLCTAAAALTRGEGSWHGTYRGYWEAIPDGRQKNWVSTQGKVHFIWVLTCAHCHYESSLPCPAPSRAGRCKDWAKHSPSELTALAMTTKAGSSPRCCSFSCLSRLALWRCRINQP